MDKYRILSMDGSSMTGGNGFVTAGLLQGMQASLKSAAGSPALLDNVFMFAGTSAGAFNALFLAKWQHPDEALPHILEFWRLLMNANNPLESLSACRARSPARTRSFPPRGYTAFSGIISATCGSATLNRRF
jgi:predicted acylesterase/phospholipase RssA